MIYELKLVKGPAPRISGSEILYFLKFELKSFVNIMPTDWYSSKFAQLLWGTKKLLSKPSILRGISKLKNLSLTVLEKSNLFSVIKLIICFFI